MALDQFSAYHAHPYPNTGKVWKGRRESSAGLLTSKPIDALADVAFQYVCQLGLEGIVSKKLGSRYESGSQFDHSGTVLQITTNQLTLPDPGNGLAVWVVVQSALPFTSLTLFEPSGNNEDQYVGNFVTGPAPAPLPSSLLLQLTGIALLGLLGALRGGHGKPSAAFISSARRNPALPNWFNACLFAHCA